MAGARFAEANDDRRIFSGRAVVAGVLVVVALAAVLARLAKLQVTDYEHFTTLSKENRVKVQPLPPTRGLIYDAKGVLLADNFASYSLDLTPEKVDDLGATIEAFRKLIPIDDKDVRRFERLRGQGRSQSAVNNWAR